MKHFLILLLAIFSIQNCCLGDNSLSREQVKALLAATNAQPILSVTNLPPEIYSLCADTKGRLAEPNGKWEATDFIRDATIPRHRLIWAVRAGENYVIHYESGGYAHTYALLVAEMKDGVVKPTSVWRGRDNSHPKDFHAFLDALRNDQLHDK